MKASYIGRNRLSSVLLGLFTTVTYPTSSAACGGGGFSSVATTVGIDVQRVFLSVRDDSTEVVTQVAVPQTPDYGVLLPVAGEPVLDEIPVSSDALDRLDAATAPDIEITSHDADPSCGCPLVTGTDKGGGGPPLRTSMPVRIGPVTATVVGGSDPVAVNAWLSDNGYVVPSSHQSTFESYLGPGRYFVALERNEDAASGPSSIGVHFTLRGDQRSLPLRFAGIGSGARATFTVFVAAPTIVGPASPFSALTLDDLDDEQLRSNDYAGAIAAAVADHEFRAFVIESSFARSDLDALLPATLLSLLEPDAHLTRLTTIVPADALTDDAVLDAPVSGTPPNRRVVMRRPVSEARAAGTRFVLVALWYLRRRKADAGRQQAPRGRARERESSR